MKVGAYISFVFAFLCFNISISAQTYMSHKLKKAVEILGIEKQLETLSPNHTVKIHTDDGQLVCIRTNQSKVIEHVGIPLFNVEIRTLQPSPVYDFIEYAVLIWKYKLSDNLLYLSKVIFKKGDWNTLATRGLEDCECSITNKDDKLYIVTWRQNQEDIAVVGVPIEYELLANDNRRNIEKDFIKNLLEHRIDSAASPQSSVTENELKIYSTGGLFVKEGDFYMMPYLNQNQYYILKTIKEDIDTVINGKPVRMTLEDVLPMVLIDRDFPAETFSNLMISDDAQIPNINMEIVFHLSDYHKQKVTIPLLQLRDYCRQLGCENFFAFQGISDGIAKGVLFIRNIRKGYHHLLNIKIPVDMLLSANPMVQSNAYLFIPPVEKSQLFGKMPTKKSGAKIKF